MARRAQLQAPGPEMTQPARSAMAAFAASRCRSSRHGAPLRAEIGLDLGEKDIEDIVVFLRAAIVSTLLATGHGHQDRIRRLGGEARNTRSSRGPRPRGPGASACGSPDAPWEAPGSSSSPGSVAAGDSAIQVEGRCPSWTPTAANGRPRQTTTFSSERLSSAARQLQAGPGARDAGIRPQSPPSGKTGTG